MIYNGITKRTRYNRYANIINWLFKIYVVILLIEIKQSNTNMIALHMYFGG